MCLLVVTCKVGSTKYSSFYEGNDSICFFHVFRGYSYLLRRVIATVLSYYIYNGGVFNEKMLTFNKACGVKELK